MSWFWKLLNDNCRKFYEYMPNDHIIEWFRVDSNILFILKYVVNLNFNFGKMNDFSIYLMEIQREEGSRFVFCLRNKLADTAFAISSEFSMRNSRKFIILRYCLPWTLSWLYFFRLQIVVRYYFCKNANRNRFSMKKIHFQGRISFIRRIEINSYNINS